MKSRNLCGKLLVVFSLASCSAFAAENTAKEDLRLTLPPEFYAACGVETAVYFDNIVLTETPQDYQFVIKCKIGQSEERRWVLTPGEADVGTHEFSVMVQNGKGKTVAKGKTKLVVVPAEAGKDKKFSLLVVGDSLTAAQQYPNEIGQLFSQPGNPELTMLGTCKGKDSVRFQGYGGWTWKSFASKYEAEPDLKNRKFSSPFVFLDKDGKPELNLERYFQESCGGQKPDFITVLLGINDCFGANPDEPKNIDERIDAMFAQADILIAAFRQAAPDAEIGLGITTPPNSRESGFEANYKGKYHRWGWKRIQHRLVERQLEKFNQPKKKLFIVPTELNIDPVDGYPDNNGVHPNATGYKQIGASFYAWLKWRMGQK